MSKNQKLDEICIRLTNLLIEFGLKLNKDFDGFNFLADSNFDSFELITFITDVEIEFGVQFTTEELANDKHHIISGLASLILKKSE